MPRATVLQMTPLPEIAEQMLAARFEVVKAAAWRDSGGETSHLIAGIATTARGAVDRALLDSLPALRIIACYSAGTEGIDRGEAERRGIRVTTTSSLIAGEVADLGMGLAIALARRMPEGQAHILNGGWDAGPMPLGRSLSALRMGIVGMGNIGKAMARRAVAFDMAVRWHGPKAKPDIAPPYEPDLLALARDSDVLVLCCPETPETREMIDAPVLHALGPDGWLINIARGRIVDEVALVAAIETGTIAGAGLDAFADEPRVPRSLATHPRVICVPHIGAATVEIRKAMAEHMVARLIEAIV